jgi:hypothetical protein
VKTPHNRKGTAPVPGRSKPKTEHDAFAERLRLVADSPYIGTVRKLAAISGVKFESTVHAWLKKAEPKRDALKRIADAAHVSLDWLVSGEPYVRLRFYDLRESQGFNEVFLESGEPSKEPTLRWSIFNLEWLSGASELSKQYIKRWQNPMIASRELFAVRTASSDGAMRPLIDDGDVAIVLRAGVPFTPDRIVTVPVILSREGKVFARLAGFAPDGRVSIGAVDPASPSGVVRMGAPERTLPASPDLFVWPQVRIFGRIVWCGRSLLDIQ